MKNINPFACYSAQLIERIKRSRSQKNPSLWLYQNDLRTQAFMMESLCRLFERGLGNANFEKANKLFKKLEDVLGQIDFYDAFYKEFKKNKKIGADVKAYILKKKNKELDRFEELLNKKSGLENRIRQFDGFVKEQKINFDSTTIKKIETALENEIVLIGELVKETKGNFTKMEEEVHELRRKIRWLSIYGVSLQGVIKLESNHKKENWDKKYLTKKIIDLPFNKLPVHNFPAHVFYNRNNFYALSWLIFELGQLKDSGFRIEFLAKVIRKTTDVSSEAAQKKAEIALGVKENEAALFKHASRICKDFFAKDKILNGLIIKPVQKKRAVY